MPGLLGDSLRRRRGGLGGGDAPGGGGGGGGGGIGGGGTGGGPGAGPPSRGPRRRVHWPRWIVAGILGGALALGLGYGLAVLVLFPAPPDSGDQVRVPVLTGMTLAQAKQSLATRRLQLGDTTLLAADEPAGTVIAQSALGGQELMPGARVNVGVAAPHSVVAVPPVEGLGEKAADALLRTAGLSADTLSQPDSTTPGRVLAVRPPAGSKVDPPGPVVLIVSAGPAPPDTAIVPADTGVGASLPGDTAQAHPPATTDTTGRGAPPSAGSARRDTSTRGVAGHDTTGVARNTAHLLGSGTG